MSAYRGREKNDMNMEDGVKRFDLANGMPSVKVKLSAKEAIGFGQLLIMLKHNNMFGNSHVENVAKTFFDAAQSVSERVFEGFNFPKDHKATVGEQMRLAAESGEEGCEVEITPTKLVVFSGFLMNFGEDAKEADPVIGEVIDRIIDQAKTIVSDVEKMAAEGIRPTQLGAKA
jgi:hypothetical protein